MTKSKLILDDFKWVARDEDDSLWVFKNKPEKIYNAWGAQGKVKRIRAEVENYIFSDVKWEDGEPTLIADCRIDKNDWMSPENIDVDDENENYEEALAEIAKKTINIDPRKLTAKVPSLSEEVSDTQVFAQVLNQAYETYKSKNHDYGNAFNESVEEFGMDYAYGKLYEKMKRLMKLRKSEGLVDESVEDTLLDLGNYAFMTLAYLKSED